MVMRGSQQGASGDSSDATDDERSFGRLGLREINLAVPAGGSNTVVVSPDLAGKDGTVWMFAYRCDVSQGDDGCPTVSRPPSNGYDLPVGPDFAVRIRFTESSGLKAAELAQSLPGPGVRHQASLAAPGGTVRRRYAHG